MPISVIKAFAVVMLLFSGALPSKAQVILASFTAPASAGPGGSVTVQGSGFPLGTIGKTSVTITLTAKSGGAPIVFQSVDVGQTGSSRLVSFVIPSSVLVSAPALYSLDLSGATASGTPYANTTSSAVTINPPPTISAVAPAAGSQGSTIQGVVISGNFTNFLSSSTVLIGSPGGVTVSKIAIINTHLLSATFVIASNAQLGTRDISVSTGTEIASLATGFSVSQGPALPLTVVSPATVQPGQNTTVLLTGAGTHFVAGQTKTTFGDNVKVNSVSVLNSTQLSVAISVSALPRVGFRTITAVTGSESAIAGPQAFAVNAPAASLISITPNSLTTSSSQQVTVVGLNTHFLQNSSVPSASPGVSFSNISVTSATSLTAVVSIGAAAILGAHDLSVSTEGEVETLTGGLVVVPPPPVLSNVTPLSAVQGSSISLAVTGLNTNFQQTSVNPDFGSDISTAAIVNSGTSVTVNTSVSSTAKTGGRQVVLYSGNTALHFAFTVMPGVPSLSALAPMAGQQGSTFNVHITSQFTHWVQGITSASFGAGVIVNSLAVGADQVSADANITVDAIALAGPRSVTFTTGAETASASLFTVVTGPAAVKTLTPAVGDLAEHLLVSIQGQSTHWSQGQTQFSIMGGGFDITVNSFIVSSPLSAVADLTIAPSAGLGSRSIYISTAGETVTSTLFGVAKQFDWYVDKLSGSDSNLGTARSQPFQTIAKVMSQRSLAAGQRIGLASGTCQRWREQHHHGHG